MAAKGQLVPRPAFDFVTSFFPGVARQRRDYGAYGVDFNTLAASAANAEQEFKIDNDADFIALSISGVMTTDATGATEQSFWEALIDIRDSGSGQSWFNGRQHMHNVVGRMAVDGRGAYAFPVPRWCPAGSAVTIVLQNLEANARRVWITVHGQRVYRNMKPIPAQEGVTIMPVTVQDPAPVVRR